MVANLMVYNSCHNKGPFNAWMWKLKEDRSFTRLLSLATISSENVERQIHLKLKSAVCLQNFLIGDLIPLALTDGLTRVGKKWAEVWCDLSTNVVFYQPWKCRDVSIKPCANLVRRWRSEGMQILISFLHLSNFARWNVDLDCIIYESLTYLLNSNTFQGIWCLESFIHVLVTFKKICKASLIFLCFLGSKPSLSFKGGRDWILNMFISDNFLFRVNETGLKFKTNQSKLINGEGYHTLSWLGATVCVYFVTTCIPRLFNGHHFRLDN